MMENKFIGAYRKTGSSPLTSKDKTLLHRADDELKTYVTSASKVPEGYELHEGKQGGMYYTPKQRLKEHSNGDKQSLDKESPAPDIEGASEQVKVSGNGVGIVAGMVDGRLKVQKLGNKETAVFVKKVMDCADGEEKKFISCLKKQAKSEDLNVSS
jgi:hypothetical protein